MKYVPKLACPLPRRTQHAGNGGTTVNSKQSANSDRRIQETWYRMLCIMPQMSPERAASVVQRYPTLRSLWRAYQDPSKTTKQKELLLAWMLDENGAGRHLRKLSTQIYRILMSFREGEKII
jgi:crossover junction endonuclease EME1